MKKIIITGIYAPKNEEDWFLFTTNENAAFSFRLGGIKREVTEDIDYSKYGVIDTANYSNTTVVKIWSDGHWLYIVLENDTVIVSGWIATDSNDETSLGLQFEKLSDFETDFFDDDFKEVELS